MRLLKLLLLIFLWSCQATQNSGSNEKIGASVPISFEKLSSGGNSGFTQKKYTVVSHQDTLNKLWKQAFIRESKKPETPLINFKSKRVILVAMGEKTSGGHSIQVGSIERYGNVIKVKVLEVSPGVSCTSTTSITYPFQFISFNASREEITFSTTTHTKDCK